MFDNFFGCVRIINSKGIGDKGIMYGKSYIGTLIKNTRILNKYTGKQLCSGVCSCATLSNYEAGNRYPDFFTSEILLHRMGISTNGLEVILSEAEIDYLQWKNSIICACATNEWDKLYQFYVGTELKLRTGPIYDQFRYYVEYLIQTHKYKNKANAYQKITKAVESTLNNPLEWNCQKQLLSSFEINLILIYLICSYCFNKVKLTDVECIWKELFHYVDGWENSIEKAKIKSRLVCFNVIYLPAMIHQTEKYLMIKNTIDLLNQFNLIYDLPQLLSFLLVDENVEQIEYYRYLRQKKQIDRIFEITECEYTFRLDNWYISECCCYPIGQYLKIGRYRMNYTQVEMCEGICSSEEYSRIENGKICPNTKNYMQLMERIGQTPDYCITKKDSRYIQEISCNDMQYIEFVNLIIDYCSGQMADHNDELLYRLKGVLLYSWNYNIQYNYFDSIELKIISFMAFLEKKEKSSNIVNFLKKLIQILEERNLLNWNNCGELLVLLASRSLYTEEYKLSYDISKYCLKEMVVHQDRLFFEECLEMLEEA